MQMNLIYSVCLLLVLLSCSCESSEQFSDNSNSYISSKQKNEPTDFSKVKKDETSCNETKISLYQTWIFSLIASCVIGLSGVVPVVLIPAGIKVYQEPGGSKYLPLLLSFAVGSLLGDVFLHLLPEAWNYQKNLSSGTWAHHISSGISVLLGMFSFVILEMVFTATEPSKMKSLANCVTKFECNINGCLDTYSVEKKTSSGNHIPCNTFDSSAKCFQKITSPNGHHSRKLEQNGFALKSELDKKSSPIHITGYLNLMANSIDNFTHGLAVAASFLVGCKMGVLTTFAILIHEIPHEIGDFAILLKSGFHPWTAAKAQMSTATIGMLGVVVALSAESIDRLGVCTSWILPFTAGGFLNIALVNVLPDLLCEKDPWESIKQFICLCCGIAVMACVGLFV